MIVNGFEGNTRVAQPKIAVSRVISVTGVFLIETIQGQIASGSAHLTSTGRRG